MQGPLKKQTLVALPNPTRPNEKIEKILIRRPVFDTVIVMPSHDHDAAFIIVMTEQG
jgi:hypothetical protein